MRSNQQIIYDLERNITTRMSANIVANFLKLGFSVDDMASAMKVSPDFLHRVQRKLHSFTYNDLKRLAKLSGQTPQLVFFNSLRPVPPHLRELFHSVRSTLEVSGSVDSQFRRKGKTRRLNVKAA